METAHIFNMYMYVLVYPILDLGSEMSCPGHFCEIPRGSGAARTQGFHVMSQYNLPLSHAGCLVDFQTKRILTLSQTSPGFFSVCSKHVLKTLWEKEKLLVASNFSYSHRVFYPLGELCAFFIKSKIVLCKLFQFGRV